MSARGVVDDGVGGVSTDGALGDVDEDVVDSVADDNVDDDAALLLLGEDGDKNGVGVGGTALKNDVGVGVVGVGAGDSTRTS